MIEVLLAGLGIYLAIGVLVAVPFVFAGAKRVDPAAEKGTWGFKVLIFPGVAALWPLMLVRWVRGSHPAECSAHRRAAKK